MPRFADDLTREVYDTRFHPNVPDHVSVRAHEIMHPTAAAGALRDLAVFGPIIRWKSLPGWYGLHVDGKWHVNFTWDESFGASNIKLERR